MIFVITPLMEPKFSSQLRCFRKLLLAEAKIDKRINLLRAFKIFASFSRKPF